LDSYFEEGQTRMTGEKKIYANENAQKILRLPEVKARTGLSRSTLYLRVAKGSFPSPVSLGARAIGFVESEVDTWISDRIRTSRETLDEAQP